jgi:hypothetical protein
MVLLAVLFERLPPAVRDALGSWTARLLRVTECPRGLSLKRAKKNKNLMDECLIKEQIWALRESRLEKPGSFTSWHRA